MRGEFLIRPVENVFSRVLIYSPTTNPPPKRSVICSGSTIGSQRALFVYLTAMVFQFDANKCTMKGADQGFHNYLFYSGTITNLLNLSGTGGEVKVFKQGEVSCNATNTIVGRRRGLARRKETLNDGMNSVEMPNHTNFDFFLLRSERCILEPPS